MTHPLVAEAIKKAAVAWVAPADRPAVALWCLPLDGSLYVVTGPGEQDAPGLTETDTAVVTLRGDHGGRIVRWPAAVGRVAPDSDEWTTVAPQLAGKRLNAPGTAEQLAARWAADCAVVRLTPDGDPLPGAEATEPSGAQPPRPSPAVRRTRAPFRLHRVRKPRR